MVGIAPVTRARIGIAHLETMTGIELAFGFELFEDSAGVLVGVIENRRHHALRAVIHRHQIMSVSSVGMARCVGHGLLVFAKPFRERRIKELDQGDVQTVQPEHWFIGFIAVIMPGHRWGDDEVAVLHDCLFTIDSSMSPRRRQAQSVALIDYDDGPVRLRRAGPTECRHRATS